MSKNVLLLSLLVGTAAGGQEQDTLPALTSDIAPRSVHTYNVLSIIKAGMRAVHKEAAA